MKKDITERLDWCIQRARFLGDSKMKSRLIESKREIERLRASIASVREECAKESEILSAMFVMLLKKESDSARALEIRERGNK